MRHATLLALATALSVACSLPSPASAAAQQGRSAAGNTTGSRTIYGSQLMTPAERSAYRQKMLGLKTVQEREAFRAQHHEEMQKRARERGLQLPDMPPMGGGMGPGMHQGMGRGMNPGMGPGMPPRQETRGRAQPNTPSSSGKGEPVRRQTEQEQRERSSGDPSGDH